MKLPLIATFELEIYLGTGNADGKAIVNPNLAMRVKGFPPPDIGESIYGRIRDENGKKGAEFIGVVMWKSHHYDLGVIRIYARYS